MEDSHNVNQTKAKHTQQSILYASTCVNFSHRQNASKIHQDHGLGVKELLQRDIKGVAGLLVIFCFLSRI